ncbi:MAG TPA: GYD domain-containing protein [Syntrophales bacterium]|jgi:uncharacterized protein with GYD domain|nr:GYD domain-containing protein [Syntrophales bacterium]HRT61876.1 GYD domain-containing protein [Syntrophales bacterium]
MAKYFMFGKYTSEAVKGISARRTDKVVDIIRKFGGTVEGMYALIGEKDLVFIVDLPGNDELIQVSVSLSKLTGIGFTSTPAIPVEQFDRLTKKL